MYYLRGRDTNLTYMEVKNLFFFFLGGAPPTLAFIYHLVNSGTGNIKGKSNSNAKFVSEKLIHYVPITNVINVQPI